MYIISIIISKITYRIIKLLKIGSGYTWPGHVVMETYPKTLEILKKKLPDKIIVISGTNGKTTTVKLLKHILEKKGMRVLSNESGANLINGVVSKILLSSRLNGDLPYDVAVFELDELNLNEFLKEITPNVLALLNLSRDQLDRYWEKEVILEKWKEGVRDLDSNSILVLDESQEHFKSLANEFKGETRYFNDSKDELKNTNLVGSFNAKNINCALLIAEKLGANAQDFSKYLSDFKYAYGRGEDFNYKGKDWRILLAKNPESLNQNLKLLIEEGLQYDSLLYVLNDNVPDGKDVSWIYDVNPDLLKDAGKAKKVFVSGIRDLDMAIRLKYAEVEIEDNCIDTSIKKIVSRVLENESSKKIVVLPNYSAMLDFRKEVLGKKIL